MGSSFTGVAIETGEAIGQSYSLPGKTGGQTEFKTMTKIEKFNDLLHHMQSDIRLEVVLTDLVMDSLSLDDILIVSNSLFKRSYHHDIEKTVEVEYGLSKKKKLSIVVNREGMYDRLPEDLF